MTRKIGHLFALVITIGLGIMFLNSAQAAYSLAYVQSPAEGTQGQTSSFYVGVVSDVTENPRNVTLRLHYGSTIVKAQTMQYIWFSPGVTQHFTLNHAFSSTAAVGNYTLSVTVTSGSTIQAQFNPAATIYVKQYVAPVLYKPTPPPGGIIVEPLPAGDVCAGNPARGTVCQGGAIYAGVFNSRKYMVIPGGCSDTTDPVCGGSDIVSKMWSGITYDPARGININPNQFIPNLTTSTAGAQATWLIVGHQSVGEKSAAEYCAALNYGGFTDWHLPNAAEMAYLHCHADARVDYPGYPFQDRDCARAGKSRALRGFANTSYWTSSPSPSSAGYAQYISMNGSRGSEMAKTYYGRVRCVRRY